MFVGEWHSWRNSSSLGIHFDTFCVEKKLKNHTNLRETGLLLFCLDESYPFLEHFWAVATKDTPKVLHPQSGGLHWRILFWFWPWHKDLMQSNDFCLMSLKWVCACSSEFALFLKILKRIKCKLCWRFFGTYTSGVCHTVDMMVFFMYFLESLDGSEAL
jgi:hypothetical protein